MKRITAIVLTVTMLMCCFATYATQFDDVGESFAWALPSIEKFSEEKIIEGRENGLFAPDEFVTRAEFAKMLALTFGLEEKSEFAYSDVDEDMWFYEYIGLTEKYTVATSILDKNLGADIYAPDTNATRQELAAALASVVAERTAKTSGDGYDCLKSNFVDYEDVIDELYALVTRAVRSGLIKGYEDNTLRPNEPVTRAEAVVMLDRAREYAINNAPKQTTAPEETLTPTPTVTPTATSTAKPTQQATPRPVQDLVSVTDVVITSINSEVFYSIYYAYGGVYTDEPLLAPEDADIWGAKTKIEDIECGDVILYDIGGKGYVNGIRVMYSPGEEYDPLRTDKVYLSENMNWGMYDSGKNTEIYLGRIWDIEDSEGGYITTLELGGNTDQTFLLPKSGARISVYKPYAYSHSKKIESITARDILDSGYDTDKEYMLVKITRDVVTDVIIIDYER